MQAGLAGAAWREALLAYMAVLGGLGRFLRFGGVPMLLALALQLAIGIWRPMPDPTLADAEVLTAAWVEANGLLLLVFSLLSVWATIRLISFTIRWTLTGEDEATFLEPGFAKRELRLFGWSLVIGLAMVPAGLVMLTISDGLAALGAGAGLGWLLGGIGAVLGYGLVAYVAARLYPGLVPAALGSRGALGPAWQATRSQGLLGGAVVWLIQLPLLLLSAAVGSATLVSPAQVALTAGGYVVYAALAVAMARFWRAVGQPRAAER